MFKQLNYTAPPTPTAHECRELITTTLDEAVHDYGPDYRRWACEYHGNGEPQWGHLMGGPEIISLAGVAVALLSIIVLSFRALGSRIEKLDDKMTEISDALHTRISGHSDKYVRREDHAIDVARITAIIERGFEFRHTEAKEGFAKIEAMIMEVKTEATAARVEDRTERRGLTTKISDLEMRISIRESLDALRAKEKGRSTE